MLRKILLTGLVLAILGGSYGYYMWNKKIPSMSSRDTTLVITANELGSQFDKDKHAGKVLSVKGRVTSVETEKETTDVTLETEDPMVSINCEMEKGAATPSVNIGDEVTIKGQCDGKLMDVVMTRCIMMK